MAIGDDDSCEEQGGDEGFVANEFVGHVEAGEGGGEEAYGDDEEEDLQREGVVFGPGERVLREVWLRRGALCASWCGLSGLSGWAGAASVGWGRLGGTMGVCFLWIWPRVTAQAGGL